MYFLSTNALVLADRGAVIARATTNKRGGRRSQMLGGFFKTGQTWVNADVCGASWTCIDAAQTMFS